MLRVRTGPPQDSQLEEEKEPGSCSLDAREMKLIHLLGGENPMLVKVHADELISLGDGGRDPLDLAYGARACTRAIGCLATWRPEHWVRTKAAEIKPDGFGRYLHPGGACEFYFEYDRATEARGALTRKLEGYLKLASGWTREQELTGFPNLLVLVPEEEREEGVATAYRSATTSLHASGSLASSFPLYVGSEDRLIEVGVLGPAWKHLPTDGERLPLVDLPARSRDLYRATRCLGRYFTDTDPDHRRRISPVSVTPRFSALPPRHAP